MKKTFTLVLSLLLALSLLLGSTALAEFSASNPPIVEVTGGLLRGYLNGEVYTFAGIPYAKAERFAMPEPVDPWEGVRDAQTYGATCPIAEMNSVAADEFIWPHRYWIQNENCQNLNVWTTELNAEAKKPVMVFFHGGGYRNGSSVEAVAYEGYNLASYADVVVVTVNHRLNVLGFLDLSSFGEEYENSVHVGFADLVASLKWVNENIAAFGGDPENVTIFGQSGGGGKVLTLMHIPEAEGLFHKAISQSSGSGARFGLTTKELSTRLGELTVQNLGLDQDTIGQIQNVPYDELLAAADAAIAMTSEEFPDQASNVGWNPVPDGNYMLADYCEWTDDMPFMTGGVFSESNRASYKEGIGDGRINEWTDEEAMEKLNALYGDNAQAILAEFQKVFPDRPIRDAYFYSASGRNNTRGVADILRASGDEDRPIYEYYYTYESPVNGGTTAFHCVDLIYVFHNVDIPMIRLATGGTPESYKLQDEIAGAWAQFARTGNPSQEGLEWLPYTAEGKETMIFDVVSGMRSLDDEALRELIANS